MIIHYSLLFISYQLFTIELVILFYAQFIKFERMEEAVSLVKRHVENNHKIVVYVIQTSRRIHSSVYNVEFLDTQ